MHLRLLPVVAALGLITTPAFADPPPPPPPPPAAEVTIRIATQAPKGTLWMDALYDIKKKIEKGTKGRVAFSYYPNGSQGDEGAVIQKMKGGLLHGGLFTGIGLGEIVSKVRILEVPFLFDPDNKAEIDAVRNAIEADIQADLAKKGFTLIGWAEVGWAYIFSKERSSNLEELQQRKIWVWQGDPLAAKTFSEFGLSGVPLDLASVLTSLETNMIDSVYNSPYGLVGLQWHNNVKFMSRMTVGHGTGALLVTTRQWNKIRKGWRKRIKKTARKRLDKLLKQIEKKNDETVKDLMRNGMKIVPIPADEMEMYKEKGSKVADDMVGKLWDKEFLEKVRGIIAKVRADAKKSD